MKRILLSLTAVLFLFSLAYAGDEPKVFTEKDLKKYKSSKDDEATQKYNESVRKEQETAKKEQMKAEETPPVLKSNTIKKYSEGAKWKWGDNSAHEKYKQEQQRIQQENQRMNQELDNKARSMGLGTVK